MEHPWLPYNVLHAANNDKNILFAAVIVTASSLPVSRTQPKEIAGYENP